MYRKAYAYIFKIIIYEKYMWKILSHSMNEDLLPEWKPYLTLLRFTRIWDQISHRPRRKCFVLLTENSNKVTPNDFLLKLQISTHHQRSFLLQKMGPNTETLSWTMCRKWESLEDSVLGCPRKIHLLRAQDGVWKGEQTVQAIKDGWYKETGSSRHNTMDAHVSSQRRWQHA